MAQVQSINGNRRYSYSSHTKSYAKIPDVLELPNLVQVQLQSFYWFKEQGLRDLLDEISPISDFTGNRMEMSFLDHEIRDPKYSEA